MLDLEVRGGGEMLFYLVPQFIGDQVGCALGSGELFELALYPKRTLVLESKAWV